MFEAFRDKFCQDATPSTVQNRSFGATPSDLTSFTDFFGGCSFNRGLYRVIGKDDVAAWNRRINNAFPQFAARVTCFGFDWLGRVFAVDHQRKERGRPGVVMFEPGTGQALIIPCDLVSFHDEEIVSDGDPALAETAHKRWLSIGECAPAFEQCVGYKRPLFLGGADDFENFEIADLDVYWHLMGQLIVETKDLPPGTPVNIVSV